MCISERPSHCLFQTKLMHIGHMQYTSADCRCCCCCCCHIVAVITATQAAVTGILPEATVTSRLGALRVAGRAVNLEPSTQSQGHKKPELA